MPVYRLVGDLPPLHQPVLVMALDAWVDAGAAATTAAAHVARDGVRIAEFDTDELIDFRARRPILDIVDGEASSLAWPEIAARAVRLGGRDLVVLTGAEPDMRWRAFAHAVVDLAGRLGVTHSVALGAIPAAVPHTRPSPVMTTASPRSQLGPEDQTPEGLLRVPAAALSVVQMSLAEVGLTTIGFYAQIPHYVNSSYLPATIALLERLARHLGVVIPLGTLREDAERQRAELDETVAGQPEVKTYVERLEELAPGPGLGTEAPIPTADEIAAEVERYLRGE